MRISTQAVAACGVLLATAPAFADQPPRSTDWTLTLGVEGRVLPEFEGSRNDLLRPVPVFSFRRAGTPARFRSPRDGGGAALIDAGPFKFGPAIKVKLPRKESEDIVLRGLGDVGWTLEAGAFAEYWATDWLRTRVELRQGFGGHKGLVGDLSADLVVPLTERLTVSGGPRLSVGNAAALSPYYSITSGQSTASGLPVYSAGGGLKSWGAGAQVSYQIDTNWRSYWFLEYEQLAGDAARSPLVTQRGSINQVQVGIGLTRSFDIPGLW
ncbi:MAG TPA: MipA/OmpV family protein [Pseudolabrys sp.]|nr:MipA/OmpV family protein [Pseudolabrys sp.]